jgi:hypothetical protein
MIWFLLVVERFWLRNEEALGMHDGITWRYFGVGYGRGE